MEDGYSVKEPKMSKKDPKDSGAYKEMSSLASASKGAKLDAAGGVKKKDEPVYKEGCKSE